MNFKKTIDFLSRLQKNNNKEWMDENRKEYHSVRKFMISWLEKMNARLKKEDPHYTDTSARKALNRINNNLLYHPHLPTYKDHFGAGLDQVTKQGDFYIQIGVKDCFIASGYWRPESKQLKSIREAIDYNGEVFKKILTDPQFKKNFGSLLFEDEKLTKVPQGFDKNHPHIDLLKFRSFAVAHYFHHSLLHQEGLEDYIVEKYKLLLPFRRYLNQAVTV